MKKKSIVLLLPLFLICLVGGIWFFMNQKKELEVKPKESRNFFAYKGEKAALFTIDGEQVTDFIYDSYDEFENGGARVSIGGNDSIISDDGEILVESSEGKSILSISGLYRTRNKDDSDVIIDKNGKVVYELGDEYYQTFNYFLVIHDLRDQAYHFINYLGNEFLKIPIVKGKEDPLIDDENVPYITIFYNNINYLFNVYNGEKIAEIPSSDQYRVRRFSEDGRLIVVVNADGEKVIEDGKIKDLPDSTFHIGDNFLMYTENDKDYILDSDNQKYDVTDCLFNHNLSFAKDVTDEEGNLRTEFYQKGKLVNTVDGVRPFIYILLYDNYIRNEMVLLSNESLDKPYCYYYFDGTKAIDQNYYEAQNFDQNDRAIVKSDTTGFHLIDKTGKKIGNTYDSIQHKSESWSNYGPYYIIEKNDKKGVMDKDGVEMIPCQYDSINLRVKFDHYIARLKMDYEDEDTYYNLNIKKKIVYGDTLESDFYIVQYVGDKKRYYSYTTGKMFLED